MKKLLSLHLPIFLSLTLITAATLFWLNAPKAKAGFSYYRSITVNSAQVPSAQSNFPMLVSGTYTELRTTGNGGHVQNASGFDVGFYTNSDCSTGKMSWETEKYTATTGEVDYWVLISSIQNGTLFYMCYGDATISTDQSNKTAVWDSSYKAVAHMGDGSSVSSLNSKSGANGRTSGVTATTGKIAGATNETSGDNYIAWDGLGGVDSVTLGTAASDVTISFWNYRAAANEDSILYTFFLTVPGSARFGGHFPYGGDGNLYWDHGGLGNGRLSTSYASYTDKWTYVVLTGAGDNSFGALYLDGVQKATRTVGEAPAGTVSGFITPYAPANTFQIDELRVSNSVRSADWITTEFNNQSAPSSFYAIGTETTPGSGALPPPPLVTIQNSPVIIKNGVLKIQAQ